MKFQRKINDKTIKEFMHLYKQKVPAYIIGKQLGYHHKTVINCLKRAGVKIRSRSKIAQLSYKSGVLKPPMVNIRKISSLSRELTLKKAYVLGVMCGDGYMSKSKTHSYQIGLEVTDKDFADYFFECMNTVYQLKPRRSLVPSRNISWQQQHKVRICSKDVFLDLKRYNSKEFKTFKWDVPKEIITSSKEFQSQFISGFFDSEGSVEERRVRAVSTNKKGIERIGKMLTSLGIRSTLIKAKCTDNRKVKWILSIQDRRSVECFYKLVDFKIKRKANHLKAVIEGYSDVYFTPKKESKKLSKKMINLRCKNLSYEKIGNTLGVGTTTVWNNIKKAQMEETCLAQV